MHTEEASAGAVARANSKRFGVLLIVLLAIAVAIATAVWWNYYQKEQAQLEKQRQFDARKMEYEKAKMSLAGIYARWNDTLKLADTTARIALAGPVGNMQGIKRETESLMVPACLVEPKNKMAEGMNKMIDGFIQFMGDATLGKFHAQERFREGLVLFAEYEEGVTACKVLLIR